MNLKYKRCAYNEKNECCFAPPEQETRVTSRKRHRMTMRPAMPCGRPQMVVRSTSTPSDDGSAPYSIGQSSGARRRRNAANATQSRQSMHGRQSGLDADAVDNGDRPPRHGALQSRSDTGSSGGRSSPRPTSHTQSDDAQDWSCMSEHSDEDDFVPPNDDAAALDDDESESSRAAMPHLKIIRQPELEHRARYLSEGSRGAVKDSTGAGYTTVRLVGYNRPTVLEVYCGVDDQSGRPHPLYQCIKVAGKAAQGSAAASHSAAPGPSQQRPATCSIAAGAQCVAVPLRPESRMTAALDCVGILKICSHAAGGDSGARSSAARVRSAGRKADKKAAQAVRLVLCARVPVPAPADTQLDGDHSRGSMELIAITNRIVCVQQMGHPEVYKMSRQAAPVYGGTEVFIIGRNFQRGAAVVFREYKDDGSLAWSAEAIVDKKLTSQCHLVCTVPTYRQMHVPHPVEVSMTVRCGKKSSYPSNFCYTPTDTETGACWQQQVKATAMGEWAPPLPTRQSADRTPTAVRDMRNMVLSSDGGGGGPHKLEPAPHTPASVASTTPVPRMMGETASQAKAPAFMLQHPDAAYVTLPVLTQQLDGGQTPTLAFPEICDPLSATSAAQHLNVQPTTTQAAALSRSGGINLSAAEPTPPLHDILYGAHVTVDEADTIMPLQHAAAAAAHHHQQVLLNTPPPSHSGSDLPQRQNAEQRRAEAQRQSDWFAQLTTLNTNWFPSQFKADEPTNEVQMQVLNRNSPQRRHETC